MKKLENCDILIAGQIPPNPAQLLNNGNFEKLLAEAKKSYDHIIIDTPPCLLVADTLNISYLADLLLFVVRCNHTNLDVLDFIKDSHVNGVIKDNSMIILNGIGATNNYVTAMHITTAMDTDTVIIITTTTATVMITNQRLKNI